MTIFKTEFSKIISKKYIWIFVLILAAFYVFISTGISDNIGVVYSNALKTVYNDINETAYNPVLRKLIIANDYNINIDEIKPFLSSDIVSAVEKYNNKTYRERNVAEYLWDSEVKSKIVNLIKRNVKLEEEVTRLQSNTDNKLDNYLLKQYEIAPKIEANMTSWNNWVDINKTMLPCLIAFVILLSLSGVYSDEYTRKMHGVLLTSKKGRKELFWGKLAASCLFSVLCVLFFQLLSAIVFTRTFGIPFTNTSLNSLTMFYMTPSTLSALQYYLLQLLGSIFGAIVLTAVVLCISSFCKTALLSFFLSGTYFGVGFILSNALEGKITSSIITLPGELSTFSVMSLYDIVGIGKVLCIFGQCIATAWITIIVQALILIAALLLTYRFYSKKQVTA